MELSKKLFFAAIAILFGIAISAAYFKLENPGSHAKISESKNCQDRYRLINQDIDCGTIDEKADKIDTLGKSIESLINVEKSTGKADDVSVFFRDLDTRRWFGINENAVFYPASLAKLPFSIMMYKIAEIDKTFLDQPLMISEDDLKLDNGQHYKPAEMLMAGKSYPVSELLRRMLVYSDNAPTEKLMALSDPLSRPILDDLGALLPLDTETGILQWNITAKSYANFFRILYNASYLKSEYSETILKQLSQSTFKNGLARGIPEDVLVSHKFGEALQTDPTTKETTAILSDCGIIYKKDAPYILCIVTQGKDFSGLEQTIRNISSTVYRSSF